MNRRMVAYTIGQIIKLGGILMIFPLIVSAVYVERHCILAFASTIIISLLFGFALTILCKPKNYVIYAKEGFVTVAFAWIILSLLGALPFYISTEVPNFFDAFFETVSGFTTTGSTILSDVESMSRGLLFWRSFTHWIGGMGVLVLMMAILPTDSGRAMHIMRAEMAGPVIGKLVPKIKDTAKILYLIYFILTVVEFLFLLIGGMPVFDSIVHALGTAGTGGFGIKADSIASYSPYLQWVIIAFMLLFSVNFNLYYLLLIKRFSTVFKSTELWTFLGMVLVASGMITYSIYPMYQNFGDSFRHAIFQVSSVMSTTGYASTDFDLWPGLAKGVLFLMMFVGGCAGSTAGGLKISRVILLCKIVHKDIKKMLHPRSVASVRLEGKNVDNATLNSVTTYFAIYAGMILILFLILSFEPFDFTTNLTAAVTCFNNVGPGFNKIGPMASFGKYSNASKFILSIAMLFGRLEIYPMLLAFYPKTWTRKN